MRKFGSIFGNFLSNEDMKRALLHGIGVVVVSVASVFGQVAQPPVITVSGSAEVKVAPDEVVLRAGVETRNVNLMEAKAANDAAMSKTLAFLKKQVDGKNLQTDFISFEPIYDHSGGSMDRVKPTAYVARNSVEVKLTDLKKLEAVLGGLMTNGVNTIHGVDFRTSQLRKHRDAARAMAIRAAREKADAAAKEAGVKLGKVYNLNVTDGWWGTYGSYWGARYGMHANMMQNVSQGAGNSGGGGESESALSAGQISVTANVTASYLIE